MSEATQAPVQQEVTLDQALEIAQSVLRAGHPTDAEPIYRAVLQARPRHPDALHGLGVARHQQGASDEAVALIRQALALAPAEAGMWNNLGNVLLEVGQVDAAADAYEQALQLDPDRADIHNNLGVLRREQGRPEEAEAAYRLAIALDPGFVDALTNLGRLLQARGRSEEALAAFCDALLLNPQHIKARNALGMTYYMAGRLDEAEQVYRDWLRDEPDSPEARHYLAACTGEGVPPRAADAYVEQVFDDFADSFDAKLANLHYRAPALVGQTVATLVGEPRGALTVLDAGCGTGLCGPLLAPYAQRLVGVDLSERMLAKAQPRKVYDALAKAELTAFMEGAGANAYDLIVSADTLCYFGDLGAVVRAAAGALRPGGWLVFTVEALPDESGAADASPTGYRLHPHGRYSHRAGYVREVLTAAGLAIDALEPAHLRIEAAKPVQGWVVAAQAGTAAAPYRKNAHG